MHDLISLHDLILLRVNEQASECGVVGTFVASNRSVGECGASA